MKMLFISYWVSGKEQLQRCERRFVEPERIHIICPIIACSISWPHLEAFFPQGKLLVYSAQIQICTDLGLWGVRGVDGRSKYLGRI
jgi:hypothetical protein